MINKIDDLASILATIPEFERQEYVQKAQNQIDFHYILANNFENQLLALERTHLPEVLITLLADQKDKVINKAFNNALHDNKLPDIAFLPVIPTGGRSIFDQVQMLSHGHRTGDCYISYHLLRDNYDTPYEPYFIFNVDTGKECQNVDPHTAKAQIEANGRSALTVVEAISLAFHTKVLDHCGVDAAGSYLEEPNKIPHLYPTISRPGLGWCYNQAHREWGVPSCEHRENYTNDQK